jgi:hypothetical protein
LPPPNPIELLPHEARALGALAASFALERDLLTGIAEDLSRLKRLYLQIVEQPVSEFRAGRVAVMGLANHTHCLLIGGLQAVESGNGVVWSSCFRGLIETFGACVLISETPSSAPSYLGSVIATKLYNAAKREHPGFASDLRRLHHIVHPAGGAIFAGSTPLDVEAKVTAFTYGLRQPSPPEGREGVIVMGNLATMVVEKLERLASNGEVCSAGKIIMDRRR